MDITVENVCEAMDGLIVEGTGTETPTTDNNVIQTGQESTTSKANTAKTGGFAPIAGLAAITLAGAVILLSHKKKSQFDM